MTDAPHGSIALAAGGTGGHMFPAEALAQELKRRGRSVILITDDRGARYTGNFPADEQIEISAASPNVGGIIAKAFAAVSIAAGLIKSLIALRQRNIVAAVGFGGYPSFTAMKAAALLKIPYGVHEQNGVLGRANRQLVGDAKFIAHAFPVLEKVPTRVRERLAEVGNPVRDAVMAKQSTPMPPLGASEPITILIFGGSQGASLFSEIAPKSLASLPSNLRTRLRIVHQARESELDQVRKIYDDVAIDNEVAPFFDDLPSRIADAGLVIARAGASTVTELSIIGRPSILVPLAIAMDDHQTGNARVLSEAGGAILLPEKEFTETSLANALSPLLSDPNQLTVLASNAAERVRDRATMELANMVEEIAGA